MEKPTKLFNRWFITCVCTNFIYCTAFYMSTPILTQHLMNLGEGAALAGFIAGIFSFLGLVFRPFAGFATDHVSRKFLVMLGLVLYSVASFGYGISPNAYWILLFRIVHAVGLAALTTAITVVATQFIPDDRTAEGIGYVTMANALATAVGPTIGVLCLTYLGCEVSFVAAGFLLLVAIAIVSPMPSVKVEQKKTGEKPKLGLGNFFCVEAIPAAICVTGFCFCAGMTTSFFVAAGTERGLGAVVSVFFIISSLGAVASRPFAGRMVDRAGLKPVMTVSFICESICMLGAAFATNVVGVVVAASGRTGGQLVGQSSLQGQIMRDIPNERRGVASSTFYMGVDMGQGLGAMLGGVLASAFGFQNMYLCGLIALALGVVSFVYYMKMRAK